MDVPFAMRVSNAWQNALFVPGRSRTLASNLDRVRRLRSTLRPQIERSPLMVAMRFKRNLEAAYRQLWHGWRQT
jgi:predicted O-linked N-acetylglucosamine transferase (SPINDLY family)